MVAPYTLMGLTALSVERFITRSTRASMAAWMTLRAPITLVSIASQVLLSHVGICFIAAAWTTTSTPEKALLKRSRLRTSPIT